MPERRPQRLKRIAWVFPIAALLLALGVTASTGTPTIQWADVALAQPVQQAAIYHDADGLLFETQREVLVRAGISGAVSVESDRVIEIYDPASRLTLNYFGLKPEVTNGQQVRAGQMIGRLAPGHPDPLRSKLWLRLSKNGEPLQPPSYPARFANPGQRILAMSCVGCHQMRNVVPLQSGRMLNQDPATPAAIERSIRTGGRVKGIHGMPAFEGVLTDEEIREVVKALCEDRPCARDGANPETTHSGPSAKP